MKHFVDDRAREVHSFFKLFVSLFKYYHSRFAKEEFFDQNLWDIMQVKLCSVVSH